MGKVKLKSLFSKRKIKLLILGFGNSGKITILKNLKISEIAMCCIQVGFFMERVENKYFNITSWVCILYYYVIDSTDQRSLDSISINITTILSEVQLIGKPILFFYNYQDAHDALSISEISAQMKINDIKDRQWFTQPTTAIDNNSGVLEGFQWLSNILIDESNHDKNL
ncbi:hypothetical protein PPL_07471 [Heterostelium album PN500]|uniref:ADP-ribosylation factor n=1 Tax=Heterostelium pallidum (strain ATCC 26659 / Pp 5 / PN500) TaxID=670386 RepID=D3BG20_HETP5|nr:hypothetical protein PPL_07471 [Heterostelium album PN500]EFA79612.1 hypothetical protein PPL_07471 [Heterostelium album PN500]|eukprot:XP_020431733.1 hypothetical protein PPL_07471 [Heterostelium album PN500]